MWGWMEMWGSDREINLSSPESTICHVHNPDVQEVKTAWWKFMGQDLNIPDFEISLPLGRVSRDNIWSSSHTLVLLMTWLDIDIV